MNRREVLSSSLGLGVLAVASAAGAQTKAACKSCMEACERCEAACKAYAA
jgi:hypothetical protein